jgi:hypothetical protein
VLQLREWNWRFSFLLLFWSLCWEDDEDWFDGDGCEVSDVVWKEDVVVVVDDDDAIAGLICICICIVEVMTPLRESIIVVVVAALVEIILKSFLFLVFCRIRVTYVYFDICYKE